MNVFQLYDEAGGNSDFHCDQVRRQSVSRMLGAKGIHDLRDLYVADTGISALPSQDWIDVQRCRLIVGGMDAMAVGRMEIPEFTAAIAGRLKSSAEVRVEIAPTADKTDTKKDNDLSAAEISDPPANVRECGRYVREQMAECRSGHRTKATKKALILEYFEQRGWAVSGVAAMDKQLQPKRHGWLLKVPTGPKKKRTRN